MNSTLQNKVALVTGGTSGIGKAAALALAKAGANVVVAGRRDNEGLGAQVVAISPQLPDNSLSTQEKNELAFPVLSDVGNKVARQFGVVFQLGDELVELYRQFGHALEDANGASGKRELPVPGTFLVDSNATIRLAHVDVDYTNRLNPDDVIDGLKRLRTASRGTTRTYGGSR